MENNNKYLECAEIFNTHGVKGLLRVGHFCDSDEVFCSLKTLYSMKNGEYKPMIVRDATPNGRVILLSLEGVDSIEEAIPLKGMTLYAAREDIAKDEGAVFIADLIGMPVLDADSGESYGTVRDVFNRGASDIYLISDGITEFMLPAVPEFVAGIDSAVHVRLIEGMRE